MLIATSKTNQVFKLKGRNGENCPCDIIEEYKERFKHRLIYRFLLSYKMCTYVPSLFGISSSDERKNGMGEKYIFFCTYLNKSCLVYLLLTPQKVALYWNQKRTYLELNIAFLCFDSDVAH